MNFLDALKKITKTSEETMTESTETPSTEGKKLTPKAFSPKFDPTPDEITQILNGPVAAPPVIATPTETVTEAVVETTMMPEPSPELIVIESTTEIVMETAAEEPTVERLTESPQYQNAMMLYYANRTQNPLISIHADIQEETDYTDEWQLTMDFEAERESDMSEISDDSEPTDDELIAQAISDAGVYDHITPESNLPTQAVINTVATDDNENTATPKASPSQEGVKIEIESATENGISNTRVNKVRMELELTPEQTLSLFKSALATQKSIMTLSEAADYLRILPAELVNLALCGKIPSFRVEDQIRFTKPTIDQWIESQSLAQMEKQNVA